MIDKKLHYVWFGDEKPKKVQELIKEWKDKLKNWEIIEWNEETFPIEKHDFVKKTIEEKKYALASDYVRAWSVYNFGGFYFDVDCKLNNAKELDKLRKYDYVATKTNFVSYSLAAYGAKPKSPILKKYLEVLVRDDVYKTYPKFMATDIHAAIIYNQINPKISRKTEIIKNDFGKHIFLSDDYLHIDVNNGNNIVAHLSFDNWKGKKKEVKETKYYFNKIDFFNESSDKKILKEYNKTKKIIDKFMGKNFVPIKKEVED